MISVYKIQNKKKSGIVNLTILGRLGEDEVYKILAKELYEYDIINTSKESHKGDLVSHKQNNKPIIIEVKNYKTSISKKEIDKLLSDVRYNNMSAILLSFNTNISNMTSPIDTIISDGNIIVFVSKFNNNINIIRSIVQFINTWHINITNTNALNNIDVNDDLYIKNSYYKTNEVIERNSRILKQINNQLSDIHKELGEITSQYNK